MKLWAFEFRNELSFSSFAKGLSKLSGSREVWHGYGRDLCITSTPVTVI